MPRIHLRQLMLAIAGIGLSLFLVRDFPSVLVAVFFYLLAASVFWLPAHGRPWWAVRAFGFAAVALNVVLFLGVMYFPITWVGIYVILATITLAPATLGFGLAWILVATDRRRWVRTLAVIGALGLAFSMGKTWWPMSLGFYVSSPSLNRLADRVEAGGQVAPGGEWAGVYWIQESLHWYRDETTLVFSHVTGGFAAFVRVSGPARGSRRDHLGDGVWRFIDQD
jgi:hypothetical protein